MYLVAHYPLHAKQAPTAPRKDAALPHVIINEKRDKKAAAKTIKQLPHLFDTREQFERTIRNPVGKEWNTPSVVEKNVRPAVRIRMCLSFPYPPLPLSDHVRSVFTQCSRLLWFSVADTSIACIGRPNYSVFEWVWRRL